MENPEGLPAAAGHIARTYPAIWKAYTALGKASALAGALVAGGYFGFAVMFLTRLDAAAPRDRVIRSAVAIAAGVVLCVMGLLLERACKVPTEPDEGEEADEGNGLEADTRD